MTRPTRVYIDDKALLHNVRVVKQYAPGKQIVAMVKANAYGCGLASVLPVLEGSVDAFGVACLEEGINLRTLGSRSECILFQGVFGKEELPLVARFGFQCVIHQEQQLQWLLSTQLPRPIKVWVKVDTGMHRLGFMPEAVAQVMHALRQCPWVEQTIGLMTHMACADEPNASMNRTQWAAFQALTFPNVTRSVANSAAILALPKTHADVVRPGIMLYGVSPFADKTGMELGLRPVMHLRSVLSAVHYYPPNAPIGYGGTWSSNKPSVIGIIPVGYGDGYPRHIAPNTPVWINGTVVPIVGRVSMDMLTVDLSLCPGAVIGSPVELWGQHIPVETIAKASGTIAYERICQMSPRVRNFVR